MEKEMTIDGFEESVGALLIRAPYLAPFILKVRPRVSDDPRVCVAGISRSGVLRLNPTAWAQLTPQGKTILLAHEILHLVCGHHTAERYFKSLCSDLPEPVAREVIAAGADLAVNEILCALFPRSKDVLQPLIGGIWREDVEKALGIALPPLQSAATYISLLAEKMREELRQQQSAGGQQPANEQQAAETGRGGGGGLSEQQTAEATAASQESASGASHAAEAPSLQTQEGSATCTLDKGASGEASAQGSQTREPAGQEEGALPQPSTSAPSASSHSPTDTSPTAPSASSAPTSSLGLPIQEPHGEGSGAGYTAPWEEEEGEQAQDGAVPDADAADVFSELDRIGVLQRLAEVLQKNIGTVPGWLREVIEGWIKPHQPSWRTILRRAIYDAMGIIPQEPSYARLPRRPGLDSSIIKPGWEKRSAGRITVVIDTSGSMSEVELKLALGSIVKLLREMPGITVQILPCDTMAYEIAKKEVLSARQLNRVELMGGGGTDMGAGLQTALEQKPRPRAVIVMSDGWTPWPEGKPDKARRCMLICALVGSDHAGKESVPAWFDRVIEITMEVK